MNPTESNVRPLHPLPEHRCAFCKTRVYPNIEPVFERVSGYVKKRKGGGANMIHAKITHRGEYACDSCVQILKTGGDPRSGNERGSGA